MPDGRARCSP